MDLPKNVTQIGEPDSNCKIYVEDYVVSYIKQLNRQAGDKAMAVALYGIRKEEAGITYLFFYGACRLSFLQRESRHLSQAVQQEAEQQRRRYFSQYEFLGYRLLNGDLVEGFHVCEQTVCRYIAGYAQFYEKNDCMLAFMLEDRKEKVPPEEFNQEKYDEVKKRQEERRIQSEEQSGQATLFSRIRKSASENSAYRLRNMKYAAAAIFVLLCVAGYASINGDNPVNDLQTAAGQMLDNLTTQQIPDTMEVANNSVQAGTIVVEEGLEAIVSQEIGAGAAAFQSGSDSVNVGSSAITSAAPPTATPELTPDPTPEATPESTPEVTPTPAPTPDPTPQPVLYTIKRGDTLIGICLARYGSDAKVAEVCNFNGITDPDDIKVGQKILLP